MGMFDDIKCEYPLPLPQNQGELAGRNWSQNQFQTKDFECLLDQYCIRGDGTLWKMEYVWDDTRKRRPQRKPAEWQPVSGYTGMVPFYDFIYGTSKDYWVEWMAVFVSGKITEVQLHRWEEKDNGERLQRDAKWKLERERQEQFLATWIGRRVYPPYAWVVHGILGMPLYRLLSWVGNQCSRAGLRLNRVAAKLAPYGDPIRAERRRRKWNDFFTEED